MISQKPKKPSVIASQTSSNAILSAGLTRKPINTRPNVRPKNNNIRQSSTEKNCKDKTHVSSLLRTEKHLINGHEQFVEIQDVDKKLKVLPSRSEDVDTVMSNSDIEDVTDVEVRFMDHNKGEGDNQRLGEISVNSILESSGVSTFSDVYEVNLAACQLEKIYNLEKFLKLRILDLSCNHIEKIKNLDRNKDLRELKLYDNRITEISGLDKLDELCNLQLQHNRISSIGKGFSGRRKLKTLRLDSNRFSKIEAKELAPLSQLTSLDLSNNRLDSLTCLNALPSLEEVHVTFNKLKTVQDLSRCKRLKEVDFAHNQLADLTGLKGLSQLTVISVSSNLLTSNSLKSLGKLRNLQNLDVSNNNISDVSFISDQFPNLEVLNIAGNRIESWSTVKPLSKCTVLTELTFQDNPFLEKDDETEMTKHNMISSLIPSLEMVDGIQLKRTLHSGTRTPVMRPMSASSVLSSRQVENQMKYVEQEMDSLTKSLSEKFQSLRMSVNSLPAEAPDRSQSALRNSTTPSSTAISPRPGTAGSARPGSRCNSRSRINQAQAFAAENFGD